MKLLLAISLLLIGCGRADLSDREIPDSDPLRHSMKWASTIPWLATDFNPVGATVTVHWVSAYDQECVSTASLSAGTMTIAGTTQSSAVQASDVPCSYYDGTWTYDIHDNQLDLCHTSQPQQPCFSMY